MNATTTTTTTTTSADQRLFQAVSESRISEIRALILRDGANVAAVQQDDDDDDATTMQSTPLHWAAGNGNYSVTRVLLELGAPVNARNKKGETPLHHAASVDKVKVACLLMDHGADIFAQDHSGRSPVSRQVVATERLANVLLQYKKEQDRWCSENETLLAVVASKNAIKMQNLVHHASRNWTAQLKEQKIQLQQRQDEAMHAVQATTHELQDRMSFLEEQQQQQQNHGGSQTLENDVTATTNNNKHHHDMSPGGGGGGPPKKRQKGLWNENNSSSINRVSFCEEQLEAQRAEIAALRQLVVLKMTSSYGGGIPAMNAAAAAATAGTGVEKNTTIRLPNGVAVMQNKVNMEQPQPLQATSSSLGPDEIQQQQASATSSSASSSDDEDEEAASSSSLLTAAMQLELQRVRVELLKSETKAQRYKQQRDEYKMQRNEYKNKMDQLHRLTSSSSVAAGAGASGFGQDDNDEI